MAEERKHEVLESSFMPLFPASDFSSPFPKADSTPLVPELGSSLVVPENSDAKSSHARRFSTGGVNIPYTEVKILSRYLAASTGSCHDYCKYGAKLDTETKTWNPMLRRLSETKAEGRPVEKNVTLVERKKKLTVSYSNSPVPKSQKPDISVDTEKEVSSSSTKKEKIQSKLHHLLAKRIDARANHAGNPMNKFLKSETSSSRHGVQIQESRGARASPSNLHGASSRRQRTELGGSKENGTSIRGDKKRLVRATFSLSAKNSVKKVPRMDAERLKNQGVSHLKVESDSYKGKAEQPNSEDVPEKILYIVEPCTDDKTREPNQNVSASSSSSPENSVERAQKGVSRAQLASPSAKKILKSSTASSKSSLASAKFTHGSTLSEETVNKAANSKSESKIRPKKDEAISTKAKDSSARSLKFRTGKLVHLGNEIGNPRRLKFKRSVHSESKSGEVATRKSRLKKIEAEGAENDDVEEAESEKVVLRHQEVEGKVIKSLLNNVIGETASKLAEARKSKVKALVSAFESVISQQDAIPHEQSVHVE